MKKYCQEMTHLIRTTSKSIYVRGKLRKQKSPNESINGCSLKKIEKL